MELFGLAIIDAAAAPGARDRLACRLGESFAQLPRCAGDLDDNANPGYSSAVPADVPAASRGATLERGASPAHYAA
jgi:hypothetical protein